MDRNAYHSLLNEIHIWWFEVDRLQSYVDRFYQILNQDEQERAGRYKTELLRARNIVAWGVLKKLISNYTTLRPDEVMFTHNRYGKPELSPHLCSSGLQFNMSHTNGMGVVALAKNNPVGVDIEEVRELHDLDDLVEFCLSSYEKSWFSCIPGDMLLRVFYQLWTAKEAFLKAIGTGLSFPMMEVEFTLKSNDELKLYRVKEEAASPVLWRLFSLEQPPNYAGFLVTENENAVIKNYNWEPGFAHAH